MRQTQHLAAKPFIKCLKEWMDINTLGSKFRTTPPHGEPRSPTSRRALSSSCNVGARSIVRESETTLRGSSVIQFLYNTAETRLEVAYYFDQGHMLQRLSRQRQHSAGKSGTRSKTHISILLSRSIFALYGMIVHQTRTPTVAPVRFLKSPMLWQVFQGSCCTLQMSRSRLAIASRI